jgi:hypothetical protein
MWVKAGAVMAATLAFGWFCLPAPAMEMAGRNVYAMGTQPLCDDPISLDKWYALNEHPEMRAVLPCVEMPDNTQAIYVGKIGKALNVMFQAKGQVFDVWVSSEHFTIMSH